MKDGKNGRRGKESLTDIEGRGGGRAKRAMQEREKMKGGKLEETVGMPIATATDEKREVRYFQERRWFTATPIWLSSW